ncbi:hypothetical protein ETU10_01450 [Apibacter muscae]|uniref:hypothetical protein n=1 Tax=Apibacter muscae TaxID=2509004 RepID=UPI0011AC62FA|nr:hypothetical protein [Apibacter muscae]TWP24651.1 hypothetical protein ETU10_01450 [Apibacter muscae]
MPGGDKKETEEEKKERIKKELKEGGKKYTIKIPEEKTIAKNDKIQIAEKPRVEIKLTVKGGNVISPIKVSDKIDCVAYHIYWNTETEGKIEKHIPKEITKGYENKYRYIYHDKDGKEHEICTVDKHEIKPKNNGIFKSTSEIDILSTRIGVKSDDNVIDGDTRRRIVFKNDDVAEYGKHPKKGNIWRIYTCSGASKVELVKMGDIVILKGSLSFSGTKRRYTSPGHFAGLIGAISETGFKITSLGSCFYWGSCFPSAEHVNGKSVDTRYLDDVNEQKFITSMYKYGFRVKQIVGAHKKAFTHAIREKMPVNGSSTLHDTHLHSEFLESFVIDKNQ